MHDILSHDCTVKHFDRFKAVNRHFCYQHLTSYIISKRFNYTNFNSNINISARQFNNRRDDNDVELLHYLGKVGSDGCGGFSKKVIREWNNIISRYDDIYL